MQTKNQSGKHEPTLTPCLDKAFFKGNKREGKEVTKETNLTRLGAGCT